MRKKYIIFILLAIAWLWCAIVEPYLMLEKVDVAIPARNWKKELSNLKIVVVGDFHAGAGPLEEWRVNRIVDSINKLEPDIVLLLGDFFNGRFYQSCMDYDVFAEKISRISAKYGKFAVLGNHDTYVGSKDVKAMLSKAGVCLLLNSNEKLSTPYGNLYIAGIADPVTSYYLINKALANIPDGESIIFLSHSPSVIGEIPQKVSITFSGHTHGGQLRLPFIGALASNCSLSRDKTSGLIEQDGKFLYINRGLGTSRVPLRFLCAPEITVVRIENAETSGVSN